MDYNWNWGIFWEFAPGETSSYLQWLLTGTGWTLATTVVAFGLALLIGALVGTLRTSTVLPLVWLCNLYTEVFRNIPLLVQMFICFFVVPELLPVSLGDYLKQDLPYPSFFSAVAALTLFTSAKLSELFKAGIESIAYGQRGAALALGLRPRQMYMNVLLPQAIRVVFPPLTSEALNTLKNSSVALTIGLMELTAQARNVSEYSFNTFEAFSAATLIYVVVSLLVTFVMGRIERSLTLRGAVR
ncbi:amino acid ABC transporter permease [Pseudomonas syringae]|nr:amino acid ABC transporter permease [Pseudomonas syringae]MBD8789039.1 amino acid ABC transporter permease [Pseudomonas syringae]MBD8800517.1 amino acid ABC transporter permease [Pseudomonas syringae]MBD8812435.1 amino acid ABC transporter permease [Pseudomonas syringae]